MNKARRMFGDGTAILIYEEISIDILSPENQDGGSGEKVSQFVWSGLCDSDGIISVYSHMH